MSENKTRTPREQLAEEVTRWEEGLLDPKDLALLFVTKNCDEAFEVIQKAHEEYRKGGKDFCYNYHKLAGRCFVVDL